ncbi:MAG: response regulator [Pseudanabaenales cyanobacterium]|nr:response regulator [Pseudanabaenales cyanobacterium]
MRKKFSRERFSAIVAGYISEVLFDILQRGTLNFQASSKVFTYKVRSQNAAEFPCISLQCVDSQIWRQVQQDWQIWEQSNLTNILPNQAPVVEQPTSLREQTSQATFQALIGLVDGQQTFRDLALRVEQPLTALTLSILPHIQKEIIRTVDVSDLILDKCAVNSSPLTLQTSPDSGIWSRAAVTPNNLSHKTLPRKTISCGDTVLYIDDSPTDSQAMAQIIEGAGYRYVNIADPLQALPQLLEIQPKLIFLDLVMPIANGYELCAQIRRISVFQETPIVIVTNNDGIADRVRAKVVGASGFLGKPIKQQRVLKVLKKYLQDHENTSDSAHRHPQLLPSI